LLGLLTGGPLEAMNMQRLGWDPSMEDDGSGRQVQCRRCDEVYEPSEDEDHVCADRDLQRRDRAMVEALCAVADRQAPVAHDEDRILTEPEGVPVTMAELVGGGR
jgi:hypothetical protein